MAAGFVDNSSSLGTGEVGTQKQQGRKSGAHGLGCQGQWTVGHSAAPAPTVNTRHVEAVYECEAQDSVTTCEENVALNTRLPATLLSRDGASGWAAV
jgi:hypothetical protein